MTNPGHRALRAGAMVTSYLRRINLSAPLPGGFPVKQAAKRPVWAVVAAPPGLARGVGAGNRPLPIAPGMRKERRKASRSIEGAKACLAGLEKG